MHLDLQSLWLVSDRKAVTAADQ